MRRFHGAACARPRPAGRRPPSRARRSRRSESAPVDFLPKARVDVGVALLLWCWRRRRDHSDGRDRRDVRDDDRVDRCDGARDDGLLVPLDCLRGRLLRVVRLCGRLPLVRGGRLGLLVRAPPSLAVRAALLPQLRDALTNQWSSAKCQQPEPATPGGTYRWRAAPGALGSARPRGDLRLAPPKKANIGVTQSSPVRAARRRRGNASHRTSREAPVVAVGLRTHACRGERAFRFPGAATELGQPCPRSRRRWNGSSSRAASRAM